MKKSDSFHREFIRLAVPVALQGLLQSSFSMVDQILVGQLGEVAIAGEEMTDIALPIAGLISPLGGHEIAYRSSLLGDTVRRAGCMLKSPFITMAFMCLPVIPELKLTDRGLFDSVNWRFV